MSDEQSAQSARGESPEGDAPTKDAAKDAAANDAGANDAAASDAPSQSISAAKGEPEAPRSARLPEPELPAAGTPEGDALRRARELFYLGDHAGMRAILTPLTRAKDPAVADAAAALLRRIAVDPVQIGFLVGCLVAILAVAFHYLGH